MKKPLLYGAVALSLVLGACWQQQVPDTSVDVSDEELPPAEIETRNVRYQGMLEEAGISLYMEGSHRLVLEDGSFIFLESGDIDLDPYIGSEVEVAGDVRPTVEDGGRIMRVLTLAVLIDATSSSSISSSEEMSSASSISSDISSVAVSSVMSIAASSAQSVAPSSSSSLSSSVTSVPPETDLNSPMGARTSAMTKVTMDPSFWTQRYCSTHIGFCIPVHKNWWYKSFGVTTSSKWHVEISSEEIFNLEDGPIVVTLQTGNFSSVEPTVESRDSFVIAKVGWTDGNHFEIRAPAVLRAAVEHIARNIVPLEASSSSSSL